MNLMLLATMLASIPPSSPAPRRIDPDPRPSSPPRLYPAEGEAIEISAFSGRREENSGAIDAEWDRISYVDPPAAVSPGDFRDIFLRRRHADASERPAPVCPRCGAERGKPCVDEKTGRELLPYQTHRARY